MIAGVARSFAATLFVFLTFGLLGATAQERVYGNKDDNSASLRSLPLHFIENQGQSDEAVGYFVEGRDKTLFFTSSGVTFAIGRSADRDASLPLPATLRGGPRGDLLDDVAARWAVKLDFVDADSNARLEGLDQTSARFSWFKGPREQHRGGLRSYRGVIYRDLWPGIDLVYSGASDRLKYALRLAPGADPARIRLSYRGADVSLASDGRLRVVTPLASFVDEAPTAFQAAGEEQLAVDAAFALLERSESGQTTWGFALGAYDSTKPLIIDPSVLIYAGFIGGASFDSGSAIAVNVAGEAFIAGSTMSDASSFPAEAGPDLDFNLGSDAFIAKISADGSDLLYVGYVGGSGDDFGRGVALDAADAAYLVGDTNSDQSSFPVVGALDATHNGGRDAFVAKITPDGTNLVYAGYVGGAGDETGAAIAVDADGAAYLGGMASEAAGFPLAVGPSLVFGGGDADAYIAKVAPNGAALLYSGFVGGSESDLGRGVAVDAAGAAYLVGSTASSEASFPVAVGPDLTHNGGLDAFIAKISVDGSGLDYAGYVGGAQADEGFGAAVDESGSAYLVGETQSPEDSFPVAVGPDLDFNGIRDGFTAKVAADGETLEWAGYIGGSGDDVARAVAVDHYGATLVAGSTASDETTFPLGGGLDETHNGMFDAFVAAVNPLGTGLLASGYLGGSQNDSGTGVAVDLHGDIYLAGETISTEADFPVLVPLSATANGGSDAFAAKIELGVPRISAEGIVNAASFEGGAIAAGEIITLFGTALGPEVGVGADLDENGKLQTERAGVKVLFDGDPGPLFFVREDQINVQVPYSADGKQNVAIQVMVVDEMSNTVEIPVAPSAPGLFTLVSGGDEIIAIKTDGTIVGPDNPASEGDIVTIYATGEGQTEPPGETGKLAVEPLPAPVLPVTLTIGGINAELLYAGAAPGFAGLMQINAKVPADLPTAALSEEGAPEQTRIISHVTRLTIGDGDSQEGAVLLVDSDDTEPPDGVSPTPQPDSATTPENTPVTINVLANDSDPEGDPLTVVSTSSSPRGMTTINPNGTITFEPRSGFNGITTFSYTVEDPDGNTGSAQVTVEVTSVNNAPKAVDDTITTIEETPVTINVLANDSDSDGDAISIDSFTQATNGSVALAGSSLLYTPGQDFAGTDTFVYTITDGDKTDSATVTVTVTDDNQSPIANDDTAMTRRRHAGGHRRARQ